MITFLKIGRTKEDFLDFGKEPGKSDNEKSLNKGQDQSIAASY